MRATRAAGLTLAWLLLAACAAEAVPAVTGPLPELAAVQPALPGGPAFKTPKAWALYSQPGPRFGAPVGWSNVGATLAVTGRWRPDPELSGRQWGPPYETWFRLNTDLPPWGLVTVWSALPPQWLPGRTAEEIPWVEAPWGQVRDSVPYSLGHFLQPEAGESLPLHTCPALACPLFGTAPAAAQVAVTGLYGAEPDRWYRVDFRQAVLWVRAADAPRLQYTWRPRREASGWRSCEPVVLFPPPPLTLCPVNAQGRYVDEFEREYDRLDPVYGREQPTSGNT